MNNVGIVRALFNIPWKMGWYFSKARKTESSSYKTFLTRVVFLYVRLFFLVTFASLNHIWASCLGSCRQPVEVFGLNTGRAPEEELIVRQRRDTVKRRAQTRGATDTTSNRHNLETPLPRCAVPCPGCDMICLSKVHIHQPLFVFHSPTRHIMSGFFFF